MRKFQRILICLFIIINLRKLVINDNWKNMKVERDIWYKISNFKLIRLCIHKPLSIILYKPAEIYLKRREDVTVEKTHTQLKNILPSSFFKYGKMIDIGANDGILGSESYSFMKLGWPILYIEPNPNKIKILKKNILPNSYIYPHALATEKYKYKLYRANSDLFETEVSIININSLPPKNFHLLNKNTYETKTINDLIMFMTQHDFMIPKIIKIDIENSKLEAEIIMSFLRRKIYPELIIIEGGQHFIHNELVSLLYKNIFNGGYNTYYYREKSSTN